MKRATSLCRGLDYPHCANRRAENLLRHHSRRLAGDIMDADEYDVHVWLIPHVSLRAWCSV